jgi:hypothetical protein
MSDDGIETATEAYMIGTFIGLVTKHEGRLAIQYDASDGWSVAVEWGREAPGEPMYAGASYGVALPTLAEALTSVYREIGLTS